MCSVTAGTASAYSYRGAFGYREDGIAPTGLSSAYAFQKVGARYYDPTFGCFLTRDTDLSQKPYAYCDGDPVNFSDPSGHDKKKKPLPQPTPTPTPTGPGPTGAGGSSGGSGNGGSGNGGSGNGGLSDGQKVGATIAGGAVGVAVTAATKNPYYGAAANGATQYGVWKLEENWPTILKTFGNGSQRPYPTAWPGSPTYF